MFAHERLNAGTYVRYIYTYIQRERTSRLASVGLAQARPNQPDYRGSVAAVYSILSAMAATDAKPVYIQDRNSGLVMEYQLDSPFQVVINRKQDGNLYQQFYITGSGVVGYVYVESVAKPNTVVSASDETQKPLFMSTKDTSHLNLNELWILREPNSGTERRFVLMSAATGLVMDVQGANKEPGSHVQTHDRNNGRNQQWAFQP